MPIIILFGGVLGITLLVYLYWFARAPSSYKAAAILKQVGPSRSWHDSFAFFNNIGRGYLQKQKSKIQSEIDDAGVNRTPQQIVIEQFTYSIGTFLLFLIMYLATGTILYFGLAVGLGIYMFLEPRRSLIKKAKQRRDLIRKETPNFALTVRLLLKGQKSPVDALKLACTYGVGEGLRDYAKRLKEDLDYLDPVEAIRRFAWSTKVTELIEFSAAMAQYITVGGSKEGEQILSQMESTFRELDKKMLEREKEVRPRKLKIMNMVIMIDGVLFIMTALILFILQLLSGGIK